MTPGSRVIAEVAHGQAKLDLSNHGSCFSRDYVHVDIDQQRGPDVNGAGSPGSV